MKLTLMQEGSAPVLAGNPRLVLLRETVRAELAARGVVTRRWLSARVVDVLQQQTVTEDEVASAIDELEDADDVVSGSYGRIAPTPLRIVDVGEKHLVVGTLPSAEWRHAEGPSLDEDRLPRSVPSGDARLAALVARFGGRQMSLARWAGLDRVVPANQSWIDELIARLAIAAQSPSDDDESPWQGFVAAAAGPFRKRWRAASPDALTHLWRRYQRAGYTEHAWTAGASPAVSPWIRLSTDEALRSAYSLDRGASQVVVLRGAANELELLERVPHAEHRWLMGAATQTRERSLRFTASQYQAACRMLRERLGVESRISNTTES